MRFLVIRFNYWFKLMHGGSSASAAVLVGLRPDSPRTPQGRSWTWMEVEAVLASCRNPQDTCCLDPENGKAQDGVGSVAGGALEL
ncbi:hypothetical protein GGTG_10611 [Gaeumannomyces tritici R3-111a-1]|uniref:Uncharacterized protein n=1 Tax=Gaeumannomyces tritici (strain R3-111a-1) TaxID=644352 RepID=J3PAT6_GAET3|nr:hypothetical protein GGTG_10611 [Gaeumannomyces tritici R3-111a-1]EJT71352.1 hypothetical protein GGTG_10611 [Gaeumannomyces tritici R3-111a-1]